jgi:hypothetical protein
VTAELGHNVYEAEAVVTDGEERAQLYGIAAAEAPTVGAYQQNSTRMFPVVVLKGVPAPTA